MPLSIQFLGASGTVTGSKYLLRGSKIILVDAGVFQGDRELEERNWDEFPIDLASVDAVLITHAHIDHIGLLPRLYKLGLNCPVYASGATIALAKILLADSGRIQQEDQKAYRKRGIDREALYVEADALECVNLFKQIDFNKEQRLFDGISATWKRAGHILGAGSINLKIDGKAITFSGDIGRYKVPILQDPEAMEFGDLLLVESTYGDELHSEQPITGRLAEIIRTTTKRNGVVVIPSFAVGRAQLLLYYLRELKEAREIPDIPVIVDSPMADDATRIYAGFPGDYDEEALGILHQGRKPFYCSKLYFTKDRNDSKRLNTVDEPMIIISASGMLTGGRIMHHILHRAGHQRNTILFVGYQPEGSVGDQMMQGERRVMMLGEDITVRAQIEKVSGLSAHGDRDELLKWCRSGTGTPKKVAVVHGEQRVSEIFAQKLKTELKWNTFIPEYKSEIAVD